MNKARKKFILFSELAVLLLLSLLMMSINVLSFTMAAEDADRVTERIARMNGSFEGTQNFPDESPRPDGGELPNDEEVSQSSNSSETSAQTDKDKTNKKNKGDVKPFRLEGGFGKFGPYSPEMESSLSYFTYSIDKYGNVEKVDLRMASVSEEEAQQWAESLQYGSVGWTNTSYRYRVYEANHKTYVTVIDQSRELWPCYRILIISIIGGAVMILIIVLTFQLVGRKLFKPLEEADRKQKQFIARLENEFKMPLTIINADTEVLERQSEPNDQTKSIEKQVRRMTGLVKELGALSLFEEPESKTKLDISDLMIAMLENNRSKYEEKKIKLSFDIEPEIMVLINDNSFKEIMRELISNSLKFSVSEAKFTLTRHKDRIKLVQQNDTSLPDGSYDQIFDRFTTLENAEGTTGAGLGLSKVKSIILTNDGRLSASVKNGKMSISLYL